MSEEWRPSGLSEGEKKEKKELEKKYRNKELDTAKIGRLRHLRLEAGEGDFEKDPYDHLKDYGNKDYGPLSEGKHAADGVDRRHREGPKGRIMEEKN